MKKKIWYLFSIILLIFFFFVCCLYFTQVNFFNPLSISISGINDSIFEKSYVLAETPLGKKIYLQKNITQKTLSTNGSSIFIKNIFLSLPKDLDNQAFKIKIKHGKNEIVISSDVLNNYFELINFKYDNSVKEYKLKYQFSSNIFQKIKSIIYWQKEVKTEILTLIFLFIILVIISILIFSNFSIIGDKLLKLFSLKRKIKSINLLFSFLFITCNILLLIYFESLIFKKSFNTYSCFIFYFLILNALLILTFVLGKIFKKPEFSLNLRISLVVIMFILFVIELILRSLQINATYFEKTYGQSNTGIYTNATNFRRKLTFTPNSELNHTNQEFKYYRKIYKEGFTQPLPSETKKKDEFRILALGDSYTEGVGSSSDSTWVELLKTTLNESDSIQHFTLFNAGVSGSDPVLEYVLLTEVLQSYTPDMVIVMINESDIIDFIIRGGLERLAEKDTIKVKEGPWWEWAFNISFVTRLVAINVFNYNHLLLSKSAMEQETTLAIEKIHKTLEKFKAYTKKNDMKLLTVFVPSPYELVYENKYKFKTLLEKINKEDIASIDMFKKFSDEINYNPKLLDKYYWKIDGHCKPAGYNYIAKTIYTYIKEKGLKD